MKETEKKTGEGSEKRTTSEDIMCLQQDEEDAKYN